MRFAVVYLAAGVARTALHKASFHVFIYLATFILLCMGHVHLLGLGGRSLRRRQTPVGNVSELVLQTQTGRRLTRKRYRKTWLLQP